MKKSEIAKAFDESLSKGWKMRKLVRSARYSLFSSSSAVYDNRVVNNRKDLKRLDDEGFYVVDDFGWLAINILMEL